MQFKQLTGKPTLYLDIDGVLNGILETTFSFEESLNNPILTEDLIKTFKRGNPINLYKLTLLRNFVIQYDIEVVNVSSWIRSKDEEHNLKVLSEFFGFNIVRSATNSGGDRAIHVLNDIINHNVENFVILDDAECMYVDKPSHLFYKDKPYYTIRNNMVNPHGRYGLNESHIEKCGQILGFHFFEYISVYCSNYQLVFDNFKS